MDKDLTKVKTLLSKTKSMFLQRIQPETPEKIQSVPKLKI